MSYVALNRRLRGDTILNRAPGNVDAFQDGIHLDFVNNYHYTKAPGAAPNVAPLTSLFTFTRAGTATFLGRSGLIETASANVPRIEYDANGRCLGLLMEASRTNLWIQSEDFSTSHSTVGLNAITTNATTAPDGTLTADRISEDTGGSQHRIRQATDIAIASGATSTLSVFVRADQKTRVSLRLTESTFAVSVDCSFNLATGLAGTPVNTGTASGGTASIVRLANGWFRCSLSGALNGGFLTCRGLIELMDTGGTTITYTGDGTSGLFIWGAQFETGVSFPSSYIPTTTVAVTRVADLCVRTLGSEFSATAGTVIVEGRASGGQDATGGQGVVGISDNTLSNDFRLIRPPATDIARWSINTAAVNQAFFDGTFANLSAFKSAAAWQSNDGASSFNGAAVLTDTSLSLPTVTLLHLGGGVPGTIQMNGHIRRFNYTPRRLPDGYLQQWSRP